MAAGSSSATATPASGTSSFSQFRLHQFVDGAPKSQARSSQVSSSNATAMSHDKAAHSPSQQDSDTHPTSSTPAAVASSSSTLTPQNLTPTPAISLPPRQTPILPAAPRGFGVLELANTPRRAVLGPYKDGRVRNPIPSKLKGAAGGSSGSFAVMQLDLGGGAAHREELAKRVSRNTLRQAEAARTDKYVSLRKRRFRISDDNGAMSDSQLPVHRQRSLTADEVKEEQARLLTLLRSLSPLAVVDQICTAIAFFGGIPGAPPPPSGVFPESAESNGSGSLFLGWLSEIFPDLSRTSWDGQESPLLEVVPGKRKRGRPKGSKARKVRSDKGIKKGPRLRRTAAEIASAAVASAAAAAAENEDPDWVDVEPESPERSPEPDSEDSEESDSDDSDEVVLVEAVNRQLQDDMQASETPGGSSAKRGRGRPKGSKNKLKSAEEASSSTAKQKAPIWAATMPTPTSDPPPILPPPSMLRAAGNSTPVTPNSAKRKRGRPPKSSYASPYSAQPASAENSTPAAPESTDTPASARNKKRRGGESDADQSQTNMTATQSSHPAGLTAEEQALLLKFRNEKAAQSQAQSTLVDQQASQATPSQQSKKRGRPRKSIPATAATPISAVPTAPVTEDGRESRTELDSEPELDPEAGVEEEDPEDMVDTVDTTSYMTSNNFAPRPQPAAPEPTVEPSPVHSNPPAKRQRKNQQSQRGSTKQIENTASSMSASPSMASSGLQNSAASQNGISGNQSSPPMNAQYDFAAFNPNARANTMQQPANRSQAQGQVSKPPSQQATPQQTQINRQGSMGGHRPASRNQASNIPQKHVQNASRLSQGVIGQSSPTQSTVGAAYYGQQSNMSPYNQQFGSNQAFNIPTSNDSTHYRTAASQAMQQHAQNQRATQPHRQQTFSPRQQQPAMSASAFTHQGFNDNSFLDLNSLDTNGGMVGYPAGIQVSRSPLGSNSTDSFNGLNGGFDGINDSDMSFSNMRRR